MKKYIFTRPVNFGQNYLDIKYECMYGLWRVGGKMVSNIVFIPVLWW